MFRTALVSALVLAASSLGCSPTTAGAAPPESAAATTRTSNAIVIGAPPKVGKAVRQLVSDDGAELGGGSAEPSPSDGQPARSAVDAEPQAPCKDCATDKPREPRCATQRTGGFGAK